MSDAAPEPLLTSLRSMARTLSLTLFVISAALVLNEGPAGAGRAALATAQLVAQAVMMLALVAAWWQPLVAGATGAAAFVGCWLLALAAPGAPPLGPMLPLFLVAHVLNLGVGLRERPRAGAPRPPTAGAGR